MNNFKYKHSIIVWVLLGLTTCACLAGCTVNVINAFNNDQTIKIIGHAVIAAITLLLAIFAFAAIVNSKYCIKNGNVLLYFGLIKSTTPLSEAIGITFTPFKQKLVVVFSDNRFLNVVINPALFDDFVGAVHKVNPDVVYRVDNIGMEDAAEE